MKMYKMADIIDLLTFEKEENNNEYVGFEINDSGNLEITVKEHEPDWRDGDGWGEAVAVIELLESAGEY